MSLKWRDCEAKFGSFTVAVGENLRKENDWSWCLCDMDGEDDNNWHGHYKTDEGAKKAAEKWAIAEVKRMQKSLRRKS